MQMLHEILGLTSCGSVAYGYGFNLVLFYQCLDFCSRLTSLIVGRVGENSLVVKEVSLLVQADHLTARAESRINAHNCLLTQWRGHQQLLQVACEYPYSLSVSKFLRRCSEFIFNRWLKQAVVRVLNSLIHQLRNLGFAAHVMAGE